MALSRVTFLMDDEMRAEFESDMRARGFRTQQEAFESMFRCKASKAVEADKLAEEDDSDDDDFEEEADELT